MIQRDSTSQTCSFFSETPIDLQLTFEISIMSIMLDLDYHHWTLIKELWCTEILLA